eukprot:scaffold81999_cov84-Phaeocystis_antarctica.AAC.1
MSRPVQFRHVSSAYVLEPVRPSSAPSSTNLPPEGGSTESRSGSSLQSSRNCALVCVQTQDILLLSGSEKTSGRRNVFSSSTLRVQQTRELKIN